MTEAFGGILRFNNALMILDVILIGLFLGSWYKSYKKTGIYIDYWHFTMSLVFFLPVLLMYPFSSSSLNFFTVHGARNLYVIEQQVNRAYLVTLTGFFGVYIGKYLFDYFRPVYLFEYIILPFKLTFGRFFLKIVDTSTVLRSFTVMYLILLVWFVFFITTTGYLKNPREFFMLNKLYQPIYTFILSTYELMFILLSTRMLKYNQKSDKILLTLIILFGFFLGVRAPLILQGLSFAILYILYKRKGSIPVYKVAISLVAVLFLVMTLVFIRNSRESENLSFELAVLSFIPEILYGNTFSDVRDFSWVLGYWNNENYWGLSYLAAILSFVPSSVLPIREVYGIGKITVGTVGLDTTTHPGLRMGIFGEMYLNFTLVGVILFGIIWGYIQRRIDIYTKEYAFAGQVDKASSVIVYSSFISYLTVSAGFWNFYISTFLLTVLYICSRIKLSR